MRRPGVRIPLPPQISPLRNSLAPASRSVARRCVLADRAGEHGRGTLCAVRCWRSWFEPDFFKQGGESWVGTQAVQTGTNAVFPEVHDDSVSSSTPRLKRTKASSRLPKLA